MKGYYIGFAISYVGSALIFVGIALLAIANWLFGGTPMWFYVLSVILVTLPFLAAGELAGRKGKEVSAKTERTGLLILIVLMVLVGMAGSFLMENGGIGLLLCPGILLGIAVEELFGSGYWDGLFPILGSSLFAVLFHLGWKTGRSSAE